ncbi:MAG: hypothetical protein HOC79_00910 [Euryarchaeota archaeon]|nr:hypothetical protein [Euryarchaeota archaeon]
MSVEVACGEWLLLKPTDDATATGIYRTSYNFGILLSVGDSCPKSFVDMIGRSIRYNGEGLEAEGYIFIRHEQALYSVIVGEKSEYSNRRESETEIA